MNEFKILWMSDVHLTGKSPKSRTDIYPNTIKEKLVEIGQIANSEQVNVIVCGGDLFHTPVVSINYAGEIAKILREWNKPILVVPGNHDINGYNLSTLNNTMLGMLESTGVIQIFTRNNPIALTVDGKKVVLEAQEYYADIDKNPDSYNKTYDNYDLNVLFAHGMLQPKPILNTIAHTVIDDIPKPADITFCGHDHGGWGCIEKNGKFFINNGSIGRVDSSYAMSTHKPSVCILTIGQFTNIQNYELKCVKPFDDVFDKNVSMHTTGTNGFIDFINLVSSVNLSKGNDPVTYVQDLATNNLITGECSNIAIDYINESKQIVGAKNINHYTKLQNNIYITKLIMTNFMSHKSSVIDFVDGVNAIVGENSAGKSTIMRAINWICNDTPKGSDVIRTNAASCEVKLVFSNGTYIKKSRTKTKATYYVYDGNVENKYEGYGTKLPVEILNTHQMPMINLYKDKDISLNYGEQMDGLFLVNCTSSEKSEAIGKLTGADVLDNAITKSASDLAKAKKEYKKLDSDIKEIDTILASKKDEMLVIESIKTNVDSVTSELEKVLAVDDMIKELVLANHNLQEDVKKMNEVSEIYNSLSDVITEIDSWNLKEYSSILDTVHALSNVLNDNVIFNKHLLNIEKVIDTHKDVEVIDVNVINVIEQLSSLSWLLKKDKEELDKLEKYEEPSIKLEDLSSVLGLIADINNTIEMNSMLIKAESDWGIKEKETLTSINDINMQITGIEEELHKNGICQMCNRPLDEESAKYILNN